MESQSPSPPSSSFWPPAAPLTAPSQPLSYMPPVQFNFLTPPPPPGPPPFSDPQESIDLSPLGFVLGIVAVVIIPALLYTFFFSIKCPSNPFRGRSSDVEEEENPGGVIDPDVVSGVKYHKDNHVKEIGSECPVCLSVFTDGEDIKQLSVCKHSFHASCIDMWLSSHDNCPICRACVPVKRPDDSNNRVVPSSRTTRRDNNDDLHQGMPDAANLV